MWKKGIILGVILGLSIGIVPVLGEDTLDDGPVYELSEEIDESTEDITEDIIELEILADEYLPDESLDIGVDAEGELDFEETGTVTDQELQIISDEEAAELDFQIVENSEDDIEFFFTVQLADSFYAPGAGRSMLRAARVRGQSVAYSSHYGVQLSGLASEIYQEMVSYYAHGQGTGNHEITLLQPFTFTAELDSSNQLVESEAYLDIRNQINVASQSAADAFFYDHPEVFWMHGWSYSFSISIAATTYEATIDTITFLPTEIHEGISGQIAQYNSQVQNAISVINAMIANQNNRFHIVKCIHDYLCNHAYYNQNSDLLSYSSAGIFLNDGGMVCEGYAKTFKVLCDCFGIPCACIGGVADTSDGASKDHMWNYVQMEDGLWYLVDTTWDDQESGIYETYLLAGASSMGFYMSISQERVANSDFSNSGCFRFALPILADSRYEEGNIIYAEDRNIQLDQPLENYVRQTDSSTYNPRLAYYLMGLASAVYDRQKIESSLMSLGFDISNSQNVISNHYNDDSYAAYYIAKKTLTDGSLFVSITVRGTSGVNEAITDASLGTATLLNGWHGGFAASAYEVMGDLANLLQGIPTSNVTYVVTGHSLGAGTANLVSTLLARSGVPTSNIYDYNFACPDVTVELLGSASAGNGFSNIFNIGNSMDLVTFVPGMIGDQVNLMPGHMWCKYGRSYWFSNDWSQPDLNSVHISQIGEAHSCTTYLAKLSEFQELGSYKTWEELKAARILSGVFHPGQKIFNIFCPVDVVIYDSNGTPLAGVTNGVINYYNSIPGQVIIATCEDRKTIYLTGEDQYNVVLEATGDGEMTYEVMNVDLEGKEVEEDKLFQSVDLTAGKMMNSSTGGTIDVQDTKLYVVNENETVIAEIHEDGSESQMNTERIPGDINGDGQVSLKDVLWLLKYINKKPVEVVKEAVDVNGDGVESLKDVLWLLKFVNGKNVVIY